MEGIWLGIKYALLDKGPDDSLMIWQSRPSKDGSNTGGKLRATEKAGAKKKGRKGCRAGGGGKLGQKRSAPATQGHVQGVGAGVWEKTLMLV